MPAVSRRSKRAKALARPSWRSNSWSKRGRAEASGSPRAGSVPGARKTRVQAPSARYPVSSDVDPRYADLQAGVNAANRVRSVLRADQREFAEAHRGGNPRYGGADGGGDEVRTDAADDEPPEAVWGAEPEGWRVQMELPERETVLDQFLSEAERQMLES